MSRSDALELAREFTRREIAPHMDQWEADGQLPRELHLRAAEVGLLGVGVDDAAGGSGGTLVDVCEMTEGVLIGGGSGGVIAGLFTHGIALPHVIDEMQRRANAGDPAGSAALQAEVIDPVLAGRSIIALAVTEPDGGSDVARLRTRARRVDGGWSISGSKTYITSGMRADVMVVAVRTGGEGAAGLSLAVVDGAAEGIRRTPLAKMGWHCSDTAELSFDAVFVPDGHMIDDAFGSLARHFAVERLSLAATAYATAQRALDLTVEWVRQRETFGRPLASRQVVRHALVDMHRAIDAARTYSLDVAQRHARGEDITLKALLAKQTAVEACAEVVDKAVQFHGGMGYMRGVEVERHYRDARILGIGGGATEVMADLAARLLGY